jgi:hypothetical protein
MSDRTELHKLQSMLKLTYIALIIPTAFSALFALGVLKISGPQEHLSSDVVMTWSVVAFSLNLVGFLVQMVRLKPECVATSKRPHLAVMSAFVVSWATFELSALIGATLTYLGSEENVSALTLLALLALLAHPPTEGKLKRALSMQR